jgi:hypothetical protein
MCYPKGKEVTKYREDGENPTSQEEQQLASILSSEVDEAGRLAVRENAKHVLQQSGLADMLRAINKDQLKGRGRFEEYDTIVLLRWGSGYTGRHLWIEVNGNTIRFRLPPHLKCTKPTPLCDGEYHIFTSSMWANRELLRTELDKYYAKPVAETSSD